MTGVECCLGNIPEGGCWRAWRGEVGGGGTPGEVKLESKLSHTVGRGPLRFSASPDTLGSWSFPDRSNFFNLEPGKKKRRGWGVWVSSCFGSGS